MFKKTLSLILSIILIFSVFSICASAELAPDVMRFNSDGKFKIVVFADTQDDESPYDKMIQFMGQALDREQPDLVVFTGDNVHVGSEAKFKQGATILMQPLIQRNIPYAYTFGNHDAEFISKEYMHSVYMSLGRCLTYNADDSIYGYGNCNIPIYSSKNDSMAFNLWMIDSNMYSGSNYDNVHKDQLDWFVRTDQAIEAAEGHKVNSLVFQHIVVPEVYNCLQTTSTIGVNTKTYNGKRYKLALNSNATGSLLEFPCPPKDNSGEFDTLKNRGDVIGIVTGHDHKNSFIGHYQGVDFIQMPGMTFESYGDPEVRGYGVIELDESNTRTYNSYTVRYIDKFDDVPIDYDTNETNDDIYRYTVGTNYISEIKCAEGSSSTTVKNSLKNAGYTVIDYDLNKGAGGSYIFMGYKTTTNYDDALKDVRFYSSSNDIDTSLINIKINGKNVEFKADMTDLNKGSGGDYIYTCYTKDNLAGPAITGLSFGENVISGMNVCGLISDKNTPAELNKGTSKHEQNIYCNKSTNVQVIRLDSVKAKYQQLSALENSDFSTQTKNTFNESMAAVKSFIDSAEETRVTTKTDSEITAMVNSMKDTCAKQTKYVPDGSFIYGFDKPTRSDEMDGMFNDSYATVTFNPTCNFMGTGSKVKLGYDGRSFAYTTVTFGDVNGDAWYDGQDAAIVRCIIGGLMDESTVGEAAYKAADCNHDGVIDDFDTAILEEAGVLLSKVDQTKSTEELINTSSQFMEYLNLIDQNPTIDDEPAVEPVPVKPCGFLISLVRNVLTFIETVVTFIKNIF